MFILIHYIGLAEDKIEGENFELRTWGYARPPNYPKPTSNKQIWSLLSSFEFLTSGFELEWNSEMLERENWELKVMNIFREPWGYARVQIKQTNYMYLNYALYWLQPIVLTWAKIERENWELEVMNIFREPWGHHLIWSHV